MFPRKREIPGFYQDPKTGKFYRDDPNVKNESLIKLKKERENERLRQNNKRPSKIRTVMDYLRDREQGGPTSGLQGIREYYKMRTRYKSVKEDVSLNTPDPKPEIEIDSVVYVKGGTKSKSIYGLWTTKHSVLKYVVGEVPFMGMSPALNLGFYPSEHFVHDLCEAPGRSVACLPNGFKPEFTYIERLLRFNSEVGTISNKYFHARDAPFFSIASYLSGSEEDPEERNDPNMSYLAVGSDGYISLYFSGDWRFNRKITLPGKVYSLTFGNTNNIIYSGHSNGSVYISDRRSYDPAGCINLERNKCINDLYYLSPDQLIATGTSHNLYTVDIKSRSILTTFWGHRHSLKKQPLSIANDLLCANGADNVIRIWHLSGGFPLHEMGPSNPEKEIRGWLVSESNKTYLYCFEGDRKIVFEI